ncbi:uncharacterized protein LOC143433171 [Xylocopa sonorina]|uniref:uncharacterized protein LOC143433171 n=1 Tax=Xylocopa sonorina TaxID=1818115 RepID=UPI00403A8697
MEWSKDMGYTLVRLYRNKEIIWNPQNPEYHQKDKRNDAWQELATELSAVIKKPVSALECKRKMDAILSSFRREKGKVKRLSETVEGDERPQGSTWFLYDSLTFLINKDGYRSRSSVKRDTANPPAAKISKSQPRTERTEQFVETTGTPNADECYSYGMFVANKLKRYSCHSRSVVQHAISEILYKADLGYYNRAQAISATTQTEIVSGVHCVWSQQDETDQPGQDFKNEAISDLENETEIFN